jgi:hypothetical protein
MFTVRIKTKSTKIFSWSSSSCRGFGECSATGLREAVIAGIEDFYDHLRGDGAREGLCACLVTWEDGNDLHAFIHPNKGKIPIELPWILMRTQPARVTRMSEPVVRGAE